MLRHVKVGILLTKPELSMKVVNVDAHISIREELFQLSKKKNIPN